MTTVEKPGETPAVVSVETPTPPADPAAPRPVGKGVLPPRRKLMTEKMWLEAEELWAAGDITLDELSKKFGGISPSHLSITLSRRGVKKGSRVEAMRDGVRAVLDEKAAQRAIVAAARASETKEEHYRYSQTIAKLAMKVIAEHANAGKSLGLAVQPMRALREAATVLEITRKERFIVLGIEGGEIASDDLPSLVIEEMSEDDIKALAQNGQDLEDVLDREPVTGDEPDDDVVVEGEIEDEGPGPAPDEP